MNDFLERILNETDEYELIELFCRSEENRSWLTEKIRNLDDSDLLKLAEMPKREG